MEKRLKHLEKQNEELLKRLAQLEKKVAQPQQTLDDNGLPLDWPKKDGVPLAWSVTVFDRKF